MTEKAQKIKIVSDGISTNTKVLVNDIPLQGVTQIEIIPINSYNSIVTAKIEFEFVELEILAEAENICSGETNLDRVAEIYIDIKGEEEACKLVQALENKLQK